MNKPFDALFDADDSTVSRIAAQCPPDWDEKDAFERSYQKYQAQRSGTNLRIPRRRHPEPLRALVTAACLMLAVGGAGSIWFFRYGVQKPQMTRNAEHAPTEQTTAATHASTTAETAKATSVPGTTVPPETVYILPETAVQLHTTVPLTSPAPVSAAPTAPEAGHTTAAVTAVQPVQTVAAADTHLPQESISRQETRTEPVQTYIPRTSPAPTQTAQEDPTLAGGVASRDPEQSGDAEQTAAAGVLPTEGLPSGDAPADPYGGTEPAAADGFIIREENGWSRVTFRNGNPVRLDQPQFSIDLEGYTLTETDSHDVYSRLFMIRNPETGDNCQMRHFTYDGFQSSFRTDSCTCQEVTIGGRTGYLTWMTAASHPDADGNDNLYTLFWDDGSGISMISDVDAGGRNTMKIADAIMMETSKN